MKLQGEYLFDGPRDVVWELVRDPDVLVTALPGTQSLEEVAEKVYEGKMNVRIGPVAGLFSGRLVVSNEVPPESCTLTVEGKGAPGFGKGSGDCKLIEQEDGKTLITYEGELQVGGTIANVGQRLIETVANSMTKQALESLNRSLKARLAGEAEGVEVEYQAPSQTEFAAGVAKDMAAQVFSPEYKNMWITVAVAIVAMAVGFWLGRSSRR
ncbi:carbon monoxide dehydrogenase subunit G [Chloroflexota bacterium]